MLRKLLALFRREEGKDLIEYALITAALSIGIIAVIIAAGIPDEFGAWAAEVISYVNPPAV